MSRWRWILLQVTRRLWVRATLIGGLGIVAAILGTVVVPFLPPELPFKMGSDSVGSILSILATSMLTVTTFSLSVMTAAYGAATNNVTPRATKLLLEDRVTQNVLSTFIGTFLFSIVGIVVLKTGAYGQRGRFVLFVVTLAVLALVVISLLRWIDYLTKLGRVGETMERVESVARKSIQDRLKEPYLGGKPLRGALKPDPDSTLLSHATGYVLHVDMEALSACAKSANVDVFVCVIPGAFVYADSPLVWFVPALAADAQAEQTRDNARKAFSIGSERSFDQDPRFGVSVLSEVAARALSTAINDHGTAIEVIGRNTRLLTLWAEGRKEPEKCLYPRIHVPPVGAADLFDDAFRPIARSGAGQIEVQLRLQKSLLALARMGDEEFRAAARSQSDLALAHAQEGMTLDADKALLHEAMRQAR